jgi:hypothetical protein
MNAIYKGKLYNLDDDLNKVALVDPDTGTLTSADYGDPDLIIDPTDDQINNILPDYWEDHRERNHQAEEDHALRVQELKQEQARMPDHD